MHTTVKLADICGVWFHSLVTTLRNVSNLFTRKKWSSLLTKSPNIKNRTSLPSDPKITKMQSDKYRNSLKRLNLINRELYYRRYGMDFGSLLYFHDMQRAIHILRQRRMYGL